MLKNQKGQAIVEAALTAPIIVFFLLTILWFGRVMLSWQQITTAARYGTDLIANTPFSKTYIENDIRDYLCSDNTIGRILDPNKLKITVEIKDFPKMDFTISIKELDQFFKSIAGSFEIFGSMLSMQDNISFVEITYQYEFPSILNIIGKDSFELKARSEVLSGTGSAGTKKRE
ncbi:MAG: pilus assembly protein [Endomicrobium sp.]|nr:pilus assembly protein [Endomicrobium sp.]